MFTMNNNLKMGEHVCSYQMLYIDLRIAFVYSVVVLTTPTAPQILTALTENSTLVSGTEIWQRHTFL